MVTAECVERYINRRDVFRFDVRESVTSTNTVLREMAASESLPEGYVLVAGAQSAGRGRMGRQFYSPADYGIYFSLLLRPDYISSYDGNMRSLELHSRTFDDIANNTHAKALQPERSPHDVMLITSAAAVAVAAAIEKVTGVRAGIKWVNDLFVNGKKVCGILTEASFGGRGDTIESAVLGVGINLAKPINGYPAELEAVAGALADTDTDSAQSVVTTASGDVRYIEPVSGNTSLNGTPGDAQPDAGGIGCRIIAAVLDNFWAYYENLHDRAFLDEYRARSIILGKDITVLAGDTQRPARALVIDDDCRLVVRYNNGETAALNSGEVSVRAADERLLLE